MRSIFAAIIMLSASTAVVYAAEARKLPRSQSGYGVGHRRLAQDDMTGANQTRFDKKTVEKDNELLDLPTTQDRVLGANQVESEQNAMAKTIEQENARLDRELRGICRGC
jgi:hypothetical protein